MKNLALKERKNQRQLEKENSNYEFEKDEFLTHLFLCFLFNFFMMFDIIANVKKRRKYILEDKIIIEEKEKNKKQNKKQNKKYSITKFVEKYDILFVIILIVYCAILRFTIAYQNTDHVWNFANIIKMCRGEVIYKDINIIITPMFFECARIFEMIFGMNYYGFLIFQTVISIFLVVLIYKVLLELNMRKRDALISLFIVTYVSKSVNIVSFYITLALVFLLAGLLVLLKKENGKISDKKYIIIESVLALLAFLSYQKMGAVFAAMILFSEVIVNKKKGFINTLKIGLICAFGLAIFCGILALRNNLYEFINIAILGMSSFKENFYFVNNFFYCVVEFLVLMISMSALLFIKAKGKISDKTFKNQIIMYITSIVMILICYPIFNTYHIELFRLVCYMYFAYNGFLIINKLLDDNSPSKKMIIGFLYGVISFGLVLIVFYINTNSMIAEDGSMKQIYDHTQEFRGLNLIDDDRNRILELTRYIDELKEKNKNVKYLVLGDYSNAISLYYGESHGYYDMLLRGNLGLNGEEKIFKDLENKVDTYLIIAKDMIVDEEGNKINVFQYPSKVDEVVKNNYNKIDELNEFEIYYGKKESIANEN